MNRREIASLICKSLALLLFSQVALVAVAELLLIIFSISAEPIRGYIDWSGIIGLLIFSIPGVAMGIVGLFYWKKADWIATRMIDDDPSWVRDRPVKLPDVMLVAFSTAGVFLLSRGIRDFAGVVGRYFWHSYNPLWVDVWKAPDTWSSVAQIAFAAWLMVGSRGLVRFILWLRTAGVLPGEDATQFDPGSSENRSQ